MKTIIIGGGHWDLDFLKGFIEDFNDPLLYIIACDSGFETCIALGLEPQVIIGDFDSVSEDGLKRIKASRAKVVELNPVKDDTDIEAALQVAIDNTNDWDEIYILGGTGKRIDHLLGNINLLGLGLKKNRNVIIVDEYNYIQMITAGQVKQIKRSEQFGKYVSVFPYLGKASGVTMTGFKYPLSKATLEGFNTLTVSNEILEERATIELTAGYLIVCESRDLKISSKS